MADRNSRIVIIVLSAIIAAGIAWYLVDRQNGPDALQIELPNAVDPGPIEVYITGAVAEPGVYEVQPGDRVIDVLYEAGGQTDDADLEAINLALRLEDEDEIIIPRQGEPGSVGSASSSTLININTASAAELDTLPGIGEVYSERIVTDRETNGPYVSSEELVERQVIPRGTYDRIRDMITADP